MDETQEKAVPLGRLADRNPYAPPITLGKMAPAPLEPVGKIAWATCLIIGVIAGICFAVLWSLGMAVALSLNFLTLLRGPGTACGVIFGLFLGCLMAVTLRRVQTTVPVRDINEFVARLDRLTSLRYRLRLEPDGERVYVLRYLLRHRESAIKIRLESGIARLEGPKADIKAFAQVLGR